jgi:hypothetical protein
MSGIEKAFPETHWLVWAQSSLPQVTAVRQPDFHIGFVVAQS